MYALYEIELSFLLHGVGVIAVLDSATVHLYTEILLSVIYALHGTKIVRLFTSSTLAI